MGDPSKLIMLEEVVKIIQKESLLENVNKTGNVLMKGLLEYQKKYSNLVHSVRGLGTFISFNLPTTEQRDKVVAKLKAKGKITSTILFLRVQSSINKFYFIFFSSSFTIMIYLFFDAI